MTISNTEYWAEVRNIATDMVAECMDETKATDTCPSCGEGLCPSEMDDNNICSECEQTLFDREAAEELINDSRLHETVDSHQWVIYYSYNLDVIKHSDNEDYYADNFGGESLEHSLKEGGIDTLHCHIAFWAFYADIQDYLETAFEEYEESIAA